MPKVNVNFKRQISDSHCGPAVIQMLLDNIGVEATQEQITRAAEAEATIVEHGTRIDQLALAVKTIASNTELLYKDHATIEDIEELINKGYPVGVEWQGIFGEDEESSEDDDGHYSIVTYVDRSRNELIIVDPYKPIVSQNKIISIKGFLKRWWDTNEVIDPTTNTPKVVKDEQLVFIVPRVNDKEVEGMRLRRVDGAK